MNGQLISDFIYTMALFVNAGLFIPQAIKIFRTKDAKDVSLITFGGFNLIQCLAVINGFYHHDYALVIGQSISILACGAVTFQVILYKIKSYRRGELINANST